MFLPIFFQHPLTRRNLAGGLSRYFKWHVQNLFKRVEKKHRLIGEVAIYMSNADSAALVNYYTGLYEFEEMSFVLHFLRHNDLFVDVGANIGVFTLLASGHVGCDSISVEPIPSTFKRLNQNLSLNAIEDKVTALNIGLGSANAVLHFSNSTENSVNAVTSETADSVAVGVKTMDDVVPEVHRYENILVKIDVEGFETEVVKGASELLANQKLKAIIIELNGSGDKYGFDEEQVKQTLTKHGFQAYHYNPWLRELTQSDAASAFGNGIYIRDAQSVKTRLFSAHKVNILSHEF